MRLSGFVERFGAAPDRTRAAAIQERLDLAEADAILHRLQIKDLSFPLDAVVVTDTSVRIINGSVPQVPVELPKGKFKIKSPDEEMPGYMATPPSRAAELQIDATQPVERNGARTLDDVLKIVSGEIKRGKVDQRALGKIAFIDLTRRNPLSQGSQSRVMLTSRPEFGFVAIVNGEYYQSTEVYFVNTSETRRSRTRWA